MFLHTNATYLYIKKYTVRIGYDEILRLIYRLFETLDRLKFPVIKLKP